MRPPAVAHPGIPQTCTCCCGYVSIYLMASGGDMARYDAREECSVIPERLVRHVLMKFISQARHSEHPTNLVFNKERIRCACCHKSVRWLLLYVRWWPPVVQWVFKRDTSSSLYCIWVEGWVGGWVGRHPGQPWPLGSKHFNNARSGEWKCDIVAHVTRMSTACGTCRSYGSRAQ